MIFSFSNMKFFAKLKIGKKKYFQRTNIIPNLKNETHFNILYNVKNFVFMRKN